MVDFHSHILPNMDDGYKDVKDSVSVLTDMKKSGVEAVALTSHYYMEDETIDEFLLRRNNSFDTLTAMIRELNADVPKLILGAEVKYRFGISKLEGIEKLCYENTSYLLIELPFSKWDKTIFDELQNLSIRNGVNPIIAHFDRYISFGNSIGAFDTYGHPIQINAEVFQKPFGKKRWLKFIKERYSVVLGSDTHNLISRKPNLNIALDYIAEKAGSRYIRKIEDVENLLLNNIKNN